MANSKEFWTIGKETFRVFHAPVTEFMVRNHYRHLDSCYDRASYAKHCIFNYWEDFFRSFENRNEIVYTYNSGVSSYNCMMFTFGACCDIMHNGESRRAIFYITKTRQEVTIYDL